MVRKSFVLFFCIGAIRSAFFYNSRRDQSDRSDFALTKTCDETERRAPRPFVLCFCAAESRMNGNTMELEKHAYVVFCQIY